MDKPSLTTLYRIQTELRGHNQGFYSPDRETAENWVAWRSQYEPHISELRDKVNALKAKYPNAQRAGAMEMMGGAMGLELISLRRRDQQFVTDTLNHYSQPLNAAYLRSLTEKADFEKEFLALGIKPAELEAILDFKGVFNYSISEIRVEDYVAGSTVYIVLGYTKKEILEYRFIGNLESARKTVAELNENLEMGRRAPTKEKLISDLINRLNKFNEDAGLEVPYEALDAAAWAAVAAVPTFHNFVPVKNAGKKFTNQFQLDTIPLLIPETAAQPTPSV